MTWYETINESLELQAFFYRCRQCHVVYAALWLSRYEVEAPGDACKACGFDGEEEDMIG